MADERCPIAQGEVNLMEKIKFDGEIVLITGGAGYFGCRLARALKEKGAEVRLFDIKCPADGLEELHFVQGDIRSSSDVEEACKGVDIVFHVASFGMSGREQLNWKLIEEVNVKGTQNIVQACRKLGVTKMVYTSTYNVVFGGQEIVNGDESLPYWPPEKHPDHYSRTKCIAEKHILEANGQSVEGDKTLHTCALRPAAIYGKGEERHIPRIVSYLENGLVCFKYGADDSLQDFVHVDNLVSAHILAAHALRNHQQKAAGQAYFISDGNPVNTFEFFRPLFEGLGYSAPSLRLPVSLIYFTAFVIECIHWLLGRVYNFQPLLTRAEVFKTGVTHYFSIEKASRDLGYIPEEHSLQDVVKDFRARGHGRWKEKTAFYHVGNLILAIIFTVLLLSWLPIAES